MTNATMLLIFLALQEANDVVARTEGGLGTFALVFMLVSMSAVVLLMVWCFARIVRGREHFDPDGTGPAKPPVRGKVDRKGGPGAA